MATIHKGPEPVTAEECKDAPILKNKVCLIAIDGWGIAASSEGNAITKAKTPVMTALSRNPLASSIMAHGLAVGLPDGIMGNSEVGHLTMGAGRIDFQDLVRINLSLENKEFFSNPRLLEAFDGAKKGNGRVHFLGLISDGAVHAHIAHLESFLACAKDNKVPEAYIHFIADGRDTPPTSGTKYMAQLQAFLAAKSYGSIATVCGRYYAMDRDKRWDRVKLAFDAITTGDGATDVSADKLIEAIEGKYESKENDEFIKPVIVDRKGLIGDNDTLIFINFRADRMREIVSVFGSFINNTPLPFESKTQLKNLTVVQMTQYDAKFKNMPILYPPSNMRDGLAEWISKHGLRQYHVAETEKYAHVTFFFNGGMEAALPGEDRCMVPSPKVATYDLQPRMNADGVAVETVKGMATGVYDLVMCNFAPPDMVGHTGMLEPAIQAVEATDVAIGKILEGCQKYGYTLVVTADHGNAEQMLAPDGKPHTAHTTNKVPLYIAADQGLKLRLQVRDGGLCDVAPTCLHIMGLSVPKAMTGKSVLA